MTWLPLRAYLDFHRRAFILQQRQLDELDSVVAVRAQDLPVPQANAVPRIEPVRRGTFQTAAIQPSVSPCTPPTPGSLDEHLPSRNDAQEVGSRDHV